jgi:short-subunit dehydrogenase
MLWAEPVLTHRVYGHERLVALAEERAHGIRVSTLTLGAVNTPLWDAETVHGDFDRRAMLEVGQVADALLVLAKQPANQVVEDLTLMPAAGAL